MRRGLMIFLAGLLVGAIATLYAMKERAHWLASLSFTLSPPDVPKEVLRDVQTAEETFYGNRAWARRFAEDLQDVLVFASPELAYRLNFSVGRYRIKAQTIRDRLSWAQDNGYLKLHDGTSEEAFSHANAYFSEQPSLNDWQASIYLEWLRQDHPDLSKQTWAEIASDPKLVAKVYSGYMGAGGDWALWRSNLTPGPVALSRMNLD